MKITVEIIQLFGKWHPCMAAKNNHPHGQVIIHYDGRKKSQVNNIVLQVINLINQGIVKERNGIGGIKSFETRLIQCELFGGNQ